MNNLSLADHIAASRAAVNANKIKGNRHDELFANQTGNDTHFIYEIIQNTEDAYKRKSKTFNKENILKIVLSSDAIDFYHNGDKFNEEDLKSITTYGDSTKDGSFIGKLGVGFKSVFAITKAPIIHSGIHDYRIEDSEVLEKEAPLSFSQFDTLIKLPFNKDKRNKGKIREKVETELGKLNDETFLFLRYISKIEIHIEGNKDINIIGKEIKNLKNNSNIVSIISSKEPSIIKKYLIFYSESDEDIKIAFELDSKSKKIISNKCLGLFVFFPTNELTNLKFIVNAPFETTPSRMNVSFEENNTKNISLMNRILKLYKKSLLKLKQLGYFNTSLLEILPTNKEEENKIYKQFYENTLTSFKNEELIPTNMGSHARARHAFIPKQIEFTQLFADEDLENVFKSGKWLNHSIFTNESLKNFFIDEVKVLAVNFEEIIRSKIFEDKFLINKEDKWMASFYKFINKNGDENIFKELRAKTIIRIQSERGINKHVAAWKNETQANVFLPPGMSGLYIVKEELLKGKDSKEVKNFLFKIGITKPNDVDNLINHLVIEYSPKKKPKLKNNVKDIKMLLDIFASTKISPDKMKALRTKVKETSFIYAQNACNPNEREYKKPNEVFVQRADLMIYFDGNPQIWFVNSDYQKQIHLSEFEELGCKLTVGSGGNFKNNGWQSIEGLNGYCRTKDKFNPLFDIEGLDFALKNINQLRSKIIWSFALEYFEQIKGKILISGNCLFPETSTQHLEVLSPLGKKLRENQWLYKIDGNEIFKPDHLFLTQLNNDYNTGSPVARIIAEKIGFKQDEIDIINRGGVYKVIEVEKFTEMENVNRELELENRILKEKLEVLRPKSTVPISLITTPNLVFSSISNNDKDVNANVKTSGTNGNTYKTPDKEEWENIEKRVFDARVDDFIKLGFILLGKSTERKKYLNHPGSKTTVEIIWYGRTHEGWDIEVKENDKTIQFIEVKSTVSAYFNQFEISNSQWKAAAEHREKYDIVFVLESKEDVPPTKTINNPYEEWLDKNIIMDVYFSIKY